MSMRFMAAGAVVATAASVVFNSTLGVEAPLLATVAAAAAGANLTEAVRLFEYWRGRWHVVAWETVAALGSLHWISVDVLLCVVSLLLAGVLICLGRVVTREQ